MGRLRRGCPGIRGLAGGRLGALEVEGVRGQVGGRRQALVQGRASVLTHARAREAQRGALERRATSLSLQQTLVPSLAHWTFKDTLLWLMLGPIWAHRRPALWSYALIHLPCIG